MTWKNPQLAPRGIRVYTDDEVKKLAKELGKTYGSMIRFAAATGLRRRPRLQPETFVGVLGASGYLLWAS